MAEILAIDKNLPDEAIYREILPQIKSLISKEYNLISNLSNFSAVLKQAFDKISWVGFYLFDGKILYLGPFQGGPACTTITPGNGVCGTAAEKGETIIVTDVSDFPGHIACDPNSRSEIVIPLFSQEKLVGVLDLDSTKYNAFNEVDKKYLQELCTWLTAEIF